jgi:formylglycine-generating enzyme required for sulfatase activity
MKKGLACLGLMLVLTAPALAWRPAGWVYYNWPYAYDHGSGDWYYFSPNNVQWSVRHASAEGWLRLNNSGLAQGWSWHTWPYVYKHANTSWYNFAAAKNHQCVNLTTDRWSIFGVPPAPLTGMATIPGGTNMGVDPDFGAYSLTVNPFHIDKYELSKAMWGLVRDWGSTRGYTDLPVGNGKAANHPVVGLNWHDCVKWCNANSQREGREPVYYTDAAYTQVYKVGEVDAIFVKASANGRRLPTAIEWEYAARGGAADARFPWGGNTIQHAVANYNSSDVYAYDTSATRGPHPFYAVDAEPHTAPMDAFTGNGYGLHNMAGNAWEWCFDWHPDYVNTQRVLRGGGWESAALNCRVGRNVNWSPVNRYKSVGFRTMIRP